MKNKPFKIKHHGAVHGVTGSCHELQMADGFSILIDCGLFQGAEVSGRASEKHLEIDFPIDQVKALIVTHVHIDHVGRIPYLLAAGFDGPIYCSEPSAILLPLVLEDAVKVGFTRKKSLIKRVVDKIIRQIKPLSYNEWFEVIDEPEQSLAIRLQPAGHILGSAYVECRVKADESEKRIVFSGDLGASHAPLLTEPQSPEKADVVVMESTYGDKNHEGRAQRKQLLKQLIEKALKDQGTVLIPAFSIGRTQELLYEIETIIHDFGNDEATSGLEWNALDVVVDSPLASRFTEAFKQLRTHWDKEAKQRIDAGRHPLSFEQLTTVPDHKTHKEMVKLLSRTHRPAIVLAASGMCAGGRIVNYLKAMIADARHDVLFVGYQASGTPGRSIQKYGPQGGYVYFDDEKYPINAGVYTIGGYSAHAGQDDLLDFISGIKQAPQQIRLIHGDHDAKQTLAEKLKKIFPETEVVIPG